jgi:hypothetical protein
VERKQVVIAIVAAILGSAEVILGSTKQSG